jgi:hypothetical protein
MSNLDLGANEFMFTGDRTQINILHDHPGRYDPEKKTMEV